MNRRPLDALNRQVGKNIVRCRDKVGMSPRELADAASVTPAEMEAIVKSLPLDTWMTTHITPLTPHPSDPVVMGL